MVDYRGSVSQWRNVRCKGPSAMERGSGFGTRQWRGEALWNGWNLIHEKGGGKMVRGMSLRQPSHQGIVV